MIDGIAGEASQKGKTEDGRRPKLIHQIERCTCELRAMVF